MTRYSTYEPVSRDDSEDYLFDFVADEVEWDDEGYEDPDSND